MTRFFRSAALLATLALAAGPASAQTSTAPVSPIALPTVADAAPAPSIGAPMIAALASADADVRGRALHSLAERSITDADLDLGPALPVLFGIYRTDAVEGHRLMALHALHLSGDATVLAALRAEVHTPAPPAVRRALLATLIAHDGVDGVRAVPGAAEVALEVLDGNR